MSRSAGNTKYFIVHFDDGYQSVNAAFDEARALHIAEKYEKYYRSQDQSRPVRKAVKCTKMSDDINVRREQSLGVARHNRSLVKKTKSKVRSHPTVRKVKVKKEGHDQ